MGKDVKFLMVRPINRIVPGDKIGIVSTSSPTTPEAIHHMRNYFESQGYAVVIAPHALANFGFLAGTAQERAADFNALLRDTSIRMIVTANGGSGAEHLLPLVDFAAIAADPKFIVGLSNPSILLNAITARTGVPTIHGPNGVDFGVPRVNQFAEENFWPVVRETLPLPHKFSDRNEIKIVRKGTPVEGRLIGGHIRTIQRLIGTPWAPEWKDSILFLEDYEINFEETDKSLSHFRLAGILDAIRGLIFGKPVSSQAVEAETLEDILLRVCADAEFPILSNLLIGHTEDKITMPIGCRVRLDPIEPALMLLESPTC